MWKIGLGILATLMVASLLPFAFIARSRASQSTGAPIHLVMDMDKQPKYKAQRASALFADERSMRPQVENTLAREDMMIKSETLNDPAGTRPIGGLMGGQDVMQIADPTAYAAITRGRIRPAGMDDAKFNALTAPNKDDKEINDDSTFYVRKVPAEFTVSAAFLERGQERFTIYCSPCHGESGYGDGPVANRANRLKTTPDAVNGWADPQNLHAAKIAGRPDGHVFNTISNGIRNMPAYDKQISIPDRWAIVAYVRALERSQNAQPGDETVK